MGVITAPIIRILKHFKCSARTVFGDGDSKDRHAFRVVNLRHLPSHPSAHCYGKAVTVLPSQRLCEMLNPVPGG